MLEFLRQFAGRFPVASGLFREVRDAVASRRAPALPTPFGFKLAGSPLMAAGAFEPEETRILQRELKAAELFVDVGANVGFYSCLASSLRVPVLAFEPLPQNLTLLLRNLRENGFTGVEVLPVGMGERPGVLTLHGGGTGASLLAGWAHAPAGWERDIAVSTLDRMVLPRARGLRTIVKLDIEGAELPALRGAAGLLALDPAPVWLVEVNLGEHHPLGRNPDYVALFELFFSAGYRAFVADASEEELDRGAVTRRAAVGGTPAHNYLFRKIA